MGRLIRQDGIIDAYAYTRYSDELNNPNSTARQLQRIRPYASGASLRIVGVYSDEEKVNWSFANRNAFSQMLTDMEKTGIRVVITEQSDRITRMPNLMFDVLEKFERLGIRLITVQEGEINSFTCMLFTLLGWKSQKDTGDRVRSGLETTWRSGIWIGPSPYGYDVTMDGTLEINQAEAAVILRAGKMYADDDVPLRTIARIFEGENIPPPMRRWDVHSFLGPNRKSGIGIFGNEIYIGKPSWNKSTSFMDAATGKRKTVLNDRSEWQTIDQPQLALMPPDLWSRIQRRRLERGHSRCPSWTRMFSGLLRCPSCGGNLTIKSSAWTRNEGSPDAARISCSTYHRESGKCQDGRSKYYIYIERAILFALEEHLSSDVAVRAFVEEYNSAIKKNLKSSPSLKELQVQLDIMKERRRRIYNDHLDGLIPKDLTLASLNDCDQTISNLEASISSNMNVQNLFIGEDSVNVYKKVLRTFSVEAPQNIRELSDDNLISAVSMIRKMVVSVVVRWESKADTFSLDIESLFGPLRFDSRNVEKEVLGTVGCYKKAFTAHMAVRRMDKSAKLEEFDRLELEKGSEGGTAANDVRRTASVIAFQKQLPVGRNRTRIRRSRLHAQGS